MLTPLIKEKDPMFYAIHTVLRNDMQRFINVAEKWSAMNEADFAAAKDYIAFHMQALHNHHHMEDTYFFPAFLKKDQRLAKVIDTLEEQHHALVSHMEKLEKALQQNDRASLPEIIAEYRNIVEGHLNYEEDELLGTAFTENSSEELEALGKSIQGQASNKDKMSKLPWILDGMDEELRAGFFKKVPFFVPFLYRTVIKKKFDQRVRVFEKST